MLTVFRMHMAFPSVLLGFSAGWITATANAEIAEVVREYHRVALTAPAQLHAHIECLGEQSGAWGTLHDGFEGWAYPFKLFEELQLSYSIDGGKTYLHQETLARTQIAEPHLARILIADDHCRVEQILFTPRSRPGIAILLNVDTQRDLRIRMRLRPRLDPMLINGNGRFQSVWHKQSKTLRVRRDSAPNDASLDISFPTNTTHQRLDDGLHEFQFMVSGGTDEEMISVVFAAEHSEGAGLADTQMALSDGLATEIRQAKRHYDQLLDTCPSVISPDRDVNRAMLWSVISLDQLRVNNPDLGRGLVSGYSSSSTGTRPRYAWFFDEPTLASHAYLRVGLNEHVREAFRMLQQYQRTDGKTVHEISQSIRFQPEFFDTYKYAYIHTDGPVYFLAAYGHYYRSTGDTMMRIATGDP